MKKNLHLIVYNCDMFQECKIERDYVMKRSRNVNLNHNIVHVDNVIGFGEKIIKDFKWKKIQAFVNGIIEIIQNSMMLHSE